MRNSITAAAWLGPLLLLAAAHSALAAPSDDMQQRLDAGDPKTAYEIGIANRDQYAGDIQFDFYFGLAAIEAGHAEQAVFALERVVIQQPENARARLELARAQFIIGDNRAARDNFQTVLDSGPPPNVRAHIQLFLGKIEDRMRNAQRHLSAHAALTVGTDSNVNSATSNTLVDVPALGQVTLTDTSREIHDQFSAVDADVSGQYLLSKVTGIFASAAIKDQNNFSSDAFDTTVVGIRSGLSHVWGANKVEVPLQYQELWVDGDSFRRMTTLSGEWSRALNKADHLSVYGQYGALRYPDQAARNVDLSLGGGSWTHDFNNGKVTTVASLYYGDESAKESVGKHNGRHYYGLRLGTQWSYIPTQALYVTAAAQKVDHAAMHPVFAVTRSDDFYQASLGWNWRASQRLSLNVELEYYANLSNISLYTYHRNVAQATLRYGFN